MATQLTGTSIVFNDSTVQNTAAVSLTTIAYDNRNILRSTTPSANLTSIVVEGLGVFTYYATGQNEPDDDETAFVVGAGPAVWLLTSPSWDFVYANMAPDIEFLNDKVNCLVNPTAGQPKYLRSVCNVCVFQPFGIISAGQACAIPVCIPDAQLGDIAIVNPVPCGGFCCGCLNWGTSCMIPYFPIVTNGCVYIWLSSQFCNFAACTYAGTNQLWNINLLRCC